MTCLYRYRLKGKTCFLFLQDKVKAFKSNDPSLLVFYKDYLLACFFAYILLGGFVKPYRESFTHLVILVSTLSLSYGKGRPFWPFFLMIRNSIYKTFSHTSRTNHPLLLAFYSLIMAFAILSIVHLCPIHRLAKGGEKDGFRFFVFQIKSLNSSRVIPAFLIMLLRVPFLISLCRGTITEIFFSKLCMNI